MKAEYKITEIEGAFYINDEQDGYESYNDAAEAIYDHCQAECMEYTIVE